MTKDNLYYWTHPEKYVRLRKEDLKNDPTVNLLEIVVSDIMREKREIINVLRKDPNNEDFISHAKRMKKNLETEFFEVVSFGYQKEILKDFIENCPKGVFENRNNSSRKNESVSYGTRFYAGSDEQNCEGELSSSWDGGEWSGNTSEYSEAHCKRILSNGRRIHIPRSKNTQNQ